MPKKGQTKPNDQMRARYRKMRVNGKQVNVCRYVMEKKLGRPLEPGEYVHHINGDRLDDRPENLEVVTPKSHSIIHNAGKPGNRKGKHHTPEAKAKISLAQKGIPESPEANKRRSETMKIRRKQLVWSTLRKSD
jgi:hypothetical protein